MTYKWLIALFIFTGNVHAEVNYRELCAEFMEAEVPARRPILPDSRSAQEIVLSLDNVTRLFRQAHPEYEVTSTFATAEADGVPTVQFDVDSAVEIVDHLFKNIRFANNIDQGLHFSQDLSDFAKFKGWIMQQTLWKRHAFLSEDWGKSVRFSAALAPSREFQELKGMAKASASIFKREIDVLRYHPSVMVFVPASVIKLSKKSLRDEFPEIDFYLNREIFRNMQKRAREERESYLFYNAPVYHDVFTQSSLFKLLRLLKKEVDEVVGSKTSWTIGARSRGQLSGVELTELIVRIDHPRVETAWQASLEFTNRYALALQKKVPLESAAPDLVPAPSVIPVVVPGLQK